MLMPLLINTMSQWNFIAGAVCETHGRSCCLPTLNLVKMCLQVVVVPGKLPVWCLKHVTQHNGIWDLEWPINDGSTVWGACTQDSSPSLAYGWIEITNHWIVSHSNSQRSTKQHQRRELITLDLPTWRQFCALDGCKNCGPSDLFYWIWVLRFKSYLYSIFSFDCLASKLISICPQMRL